MSALESLVDVAAKTVTSTYDVEYKDVVAECWAWLLDVDHNGVKRADKLVNWLNEGKVKQARLALVEAVGRNGYGGREQAARYGMSRDRRVLKREAEERQDYNSTDPAHLARQARAASLQQQYVTAPIDVGTVELEYVGRRTAITNAGAMAATRTATDSDNIDSAPEAKPEYYNNGLLLVSVAAARFRARFGLPEDDAAWHAAVARARKTDRQLDRMLRARERVGA